ncbi:hypothetical protein [Roseinatronobacter alkalisoli]|uniref:Uncharacterized protein n=1 Tax=Roseinatronobacter alkalisoli TaxID=3028235 RepID=A0ABT5TDH4_9RHOB|nr:hypothetical protein [Roseinatronobacter sp. HJB301]MDD7972421.1 hypothetical protein [Roseinatronobacter sp. HJB301]
MTYARAQAPAPPVENGRVALSDGLLRAADEARLLSQQAARLDANIGAALAQADPGVTRDLQNADILRQGLEGLTQFLTALVETLDRDGTCNPVVATEALLMRDQSLRLAHGAAFSPAKTVSAADLWDQ